MDEYKSIVEKMNETEKAEAARNSFNIINNSKQRSDIILGLCSGTSLYEINIKEFALINESFNDLNSFIEQSNNLDKSEKFEAGIKSFFIVNNLPSSSKEQIFTGYYASAMINDISIDQVAGKVVPGVAVERIESIW